MAKKQSKFRKKWYRLDTAALIFPATMRRDWRNVFRMSATLSEDIDPDALQTAVDSLMHRFPTLYVRLCKGVFWCYLEQSKNPPKVRQDFAYPVSHMGNDELKKCCLRVFYYKNRIAVEFYHALTDGNGGSVYLCTLLARYISLKYKTNVRSSGKVLDYSAEPRAEELEDSFFKNSIDYPASRNEVDSYSLKGTRESDGFRHIITGITDTQKLLDLSHEHNVSMTVLLSAIMTKCLIEKQNAEVPEKRRKWVKVTVPVNLRKLYGSKTLRNFVLTLNIGVDPRRGEYSFDDICKSISHQLAFQATPQNMAAMVAANVLPQKHLSLRVTPLFLKHIVMDLIYSGSGEKKGSLNISNLGIITLPDEMKEYVTRFDFIIGVQRSYPNNCSLVSYNGKTYINMIRNIKEPDLERRFFSALVEMGIPVDIESNERNK